MTQISLPTYIELSESLQDTPFKMHAAEAHGLVSGILTGTPAIAPDWESLVAGEKTTGRTHELLQSLHDGIAQQLYDLLFEFQLLLPQEEVVLAERAEALTFWCQGYLTGIKLVGIKMTDREPGEATEAIADLIEIAKMNYDEVVASDEDEDAYIELVEYVRMAAIVIYEDLREQSIAKSSTQSSGQLH